MIQDKFLFSQKGFWATVEEWQKEDFLVSNQKYRMTNQRQIILEEVKKVHSHPTADEVYERVRKKIPRISMGTVYRNLDVLSKTGLIRKIDPG